MDHSHFSTAGRPPHPPPQPPPQQPPSKRQHQIQGPRPSALKIQDTSKKTKKPRLPQRPQPPQQPVIIYAISPKIIHTEVSNFMSVVQRHTGLSSSDFSPSGNVSPAARLAATEKASPTGIKIATNDIAPDDDLMAILQGLDTQRGSSQQQFSSGILSPAPSMLPPVPAEFFSPVTDPDMFSQFLHGNSSSGFNSPSFNSFYNITSPSGLFSAHIFSPIQSPDYISLLMEFTQDHDHREDDNNGRDNNG